jgi:single-stranded-DNA-specific exonuclease
VAEQRSPDLIITVDNGISSIAGVAAAKQAGMQVLVTDHHLAGHELPQADAIVNPNQPGCNFAGKNTAGVGVIFYVLAALRNALRESRWFESQNLPEPNIADYLDLLALGTVADVVPLDRNNRILVEQGLRRIRAGKACPGVNALLQISGKDPAKLVASDLGFALGPRLNAAGRLDDMSLGIECLLADTPERAYELAQRLDSLNSSRKDIEADMKQQAMDALASLDVKDHQVGMSLYDPEWHQGVIGILASRIKDRFHRPVIAFADAADGEIKGSARSIKGFHIRDALDAIAKQHPTLLQKFGGHAMAAGLAIKKKDFDAFSGAFNQLASQWLSRDQLAEEIRTDGALDHQDFTLDLAYQLRRAGPWGQGFPEPAFVGEFIVLEQRLVGEKHLKLKLASDDSGLAIEAIAFFVDLEKWPNSAKKVKLVYRLEVNEFRGMETPQLMVEYLEAI